MPAHRTIRRVATVAALAVAAGALVHPVTAGASDTCSIRWSGGSGSWTDPARWAPHRVPTKHDNACIVGVSGAAAVSVQVPASTVVAGITVRSATLSVASAATVDVTQVVAAGAVLTGGGTFHATIGTIAVSDSQLAGIHVVSSARLSFAGQVVFTGGATIQGSSQVDLPDGVRLVDGDGNAANHIALSRFPLYLTGSVFVGVPIGLTDVLLLAQGGDVVLASLDNLDADGNLRATSPGATLQLGSGFQGSLTLPRSITTIGRRVDVSSGDIRTPDGSDALRTVRSISGALSLGGPLVLDQPVTVYGVVYAGAALQAPEVAVRPGARFIGSEVDGGLTCGGNCSIEGAHVRRLTLLPGSTTTTDLLRPITVDGSARLGGALTVSMPFQGGPKPGSTYVLLTASGGVTGTVDRIDATRTHRTVTPTYQPTYVTGTLGTTA